MMTTRLSIGPGSTAVQRDGPAAKLIRGSSLLFCGRLIGLALNLAVQVLAVRYLSKRDYGAFAYALAVVAMGGSTECADQGTETAMG